MKSWLNRATMERAQIHHYEIPVRPESPLEVGQKIRILALSRVAYHAPNVVFPRYEAYDPHVAGTVTRVVEWGDETVVFEVANECGINPVRSARLTVKWIPGVTALVSPDISWAARKCLAPPPALEKEVTVAIPGRRVCRAGGCSVEAGRDPGPPWEVRVVQ